ncbi:MAG TPA: hypothetical protein VN969_23140 [Streptosporangiaceae bacterium]|nr:hypothetical protein [Streptosporangiaceae bacterium]
MKIRTLAIAAAVGALAVGTAGSAMASPLSKPKPKPKPAAVVQLPGDKLKAGLLAASVFGGGYTLGDEQDTGKSLWSASNPGKASSMPCGAQGSYITGYGQTAEATDNFNAPDSSPNAVDGSQLIDQFANNSAAWSFLTGEAAAFQSQACRTASGTLQGSNGSGNFTYTITFKRLDWTKVGSYSAIEVMQAFTLTNDQGESGTNYTETTIVNAGTNDYTIQEFNSADSDVPTWLMSDLVKATQKLYTTKKTTTKKKS